MIEKRVVNGIEVGFDTATNSYCNLPKNMIYGSGAGMSAPAHDIEELRKEAVGFGLKPHHNASAATIIKMIEKYKTEQGDDEND